MKASELPMSDLVGKRVRSLMDFSGIPKGTVGVVESHYTGPGNHEGVMVEWTTTSGTMVRDGFDRDDEFDETQWLEVLE